VDLQVSVAATCIAVPVHVMRQVVIQWQDSASCPVSDLTESFAVDSMVEDRP